MNQAGTQENYSGKLAKEEKEDVIDIEANLRSHLKISASFSSRLVRSSNVKK